VPSKAPRGAAAQTLRILFGLASLSFDQFRADEKVIDAVARNLEIVGEAAKRVPEQLRAQYVDVHWRKMAGIRDVISHGSFGLDLQLVWDIVQRDVPTARAKVAAILQTAFSGPPGDTP
jgi:uncharacterized protein with HEPN domain